MKTYTVSDGLSQSSVYHFLQDYKGFLWIGTGDGLNRFDGYEFKVYKHIPHNQGSLSESTTRGIVEDAMHNLWVGSDMGMNWYDYKKGRFISWYLHDHDSSAVEYIPMAAKGDYLYFSVQSRGVFRLNIRTRKYELIQRPGTEQVTQAGRCFGNELWYYSSQRHVCRLNMDNNRLDDLGFSEQTVECFTIFGDYVIAGTTEGALFFDIKTGKRLQPAYPAFLQKENVRALFTDSYGHLWLSVIGKGIYLFDHNWDLLRYYDEAENLYSDIPFSLQNVDILYEDRSGNIWFGTDGAGFGRICYNLLKFKNHNSLGHKNYNLSSAFVKCFYQDKEGKLYIGTLNGGLNIIDDAKGRIACIYPQPGDFKELSPNTINCIVPAEDENDLLLATMNGLYFFNKAGHKCSRIELIGLNAVQPVKMLQKNRKGEIFCQCGPYMYAIHKEANKYKAEIIFQLRFSATSIFEDPQGRTIFTTGGNGLYYLDNQNNTRLLPGIDAYQKANGPVLFKYLISDNEGFIWAATNSGLFKMDQSYKVLRVFNLDDGLPDLFIYGILPDNEGNFWMSTNKGLSCFNKQNETFTNYRIEDGLQSYEFNSGAFYKNDQGEMFFGGVNGFNAFFPEEIQPNREAPVIELTKASLFDINLPLTKLLKSNFQLSFPSNQNTLSFEVAGLEYTNPNLNQYAFYLEGLESEWYYSGSRRFVRYNALKPGTYYLWAKASNSDGVWGKAKRLITITIMPPFWRTWWFISICILVAVSIVAIAAYFISSARYRKRLALLEREREIMEIRSRISRDIHDDIGAGLTRISILSQRIKATKTIVTPDIQRSLEKLSEQSKEIVQNLGEIVWTVNPQHDQLNSLLAYIRNFASDFLENAGLSYTFNFPDDAPESPLNPDLRRNLFLVVKESLNNVVKHAEAREVTLSFSLEENRYKMYIADNGKGICRQNGFGNGLRNMKHRMEAVNSSMEWISTEGAGTTIVIEGVVY